MIQVSAMKALKTILLIILSLLFSFVIFLRAKGARVEQIASVEALGAAYVFGDTFSASNPKPLPTENPNAVHVSDLMLTKKELRSIMIARAKQPHPMVYDIKFDSNSLFYDTGSSSWFYSLIDNSKTAFNPSVEFDANDSNVMIAFCGNEISEQLIADNGTIDVICYNDNAYHISKLVCTTLPLMNISVEQEIGDEDTKASITLFDNRQSADMHWINSIADMHIRGGSTRAFPKKGYKITLLKDSTGHEKSNISLLGMRKDDDWHLSALYNDPERVRNPFSCELWKTSCGYNNQFRVENGMQYEYVEVFMNGNYHGLYALGYPIDAKQMELGISAYGEVEEAVFKISRWADEIEAAQSQSETLDAYEIKGIVPEGSEALAWQQLKTFYDIKVNQSKLNPSVLYDIVDMNNAIDLHLFIQLVQGRDNMRSRVKNMYMTAKKSGENTIFLYTPWDLDMCWGNTYIDDVTVNRVFLHYDGPEVIFPMPYSIVQQLIDYGDPDIKRLVSERYSELRAGAWSEASLMNLLDEYEDDIFFSGAFQRDCTRWPDSTIERGVVDLSTFREFVLARLVALDAYVYNL